MGVRIAGILAMSALAGGCSLFGFFEDPPCGSEAECAGQGDGDADADGDAEPADFSGLYELDILNEENGCELANWTVGAVTDNVELTVVQEGTEATGQVGGLIGTYLRIAVGSDTLSGDVTGDEIELYLLSGTDSRDRDLQCRYRAEGTLYGTLVGENGLEGTIEYGYLVMQEADDCGDIGTCVSVQSFSGSRRPR